MSDPKKIVWPGGFRPGEKVMVRRYTVFSEGGRRPGQVAYAPPMVVQLLGHLTTSGVVPIIYGDITSGNVAMEMVPADDLTLIGQTRGKEANS